MKTQNNTRNVAASFICFSILIILSAVLTLNTTGFCYSQMRYVSDEEILIKTVNLDWKSNMKRVFERNPKINSNSPSQFVQDVPIWGRVNGRLMKWKILFWQDPTIDLPRRIYRIFGVYEVLSSLAIDTGNSNSRYLIWFRSFNQCGETTNLTQIDEDNRLDDDEWNGHWRRAGLDKTENVIFR